MNVNLVFDIETIPQQTKLTENQLAEFRKKIKQEYKGVTSIEDIQKMIKGELAPNADLELYSDKARMVMATNPFLGQIVCIGMMQVEENSFGGNEPHINKFALTGDEKTILKDFWEFIGQDKRFRFISYNGLGFDVPYILKRSMKYGIRPTNRSFLTTKRYQRWPHFDAMQILADWDRMRSVTIALACESFGIPSPKDGEIRADSVEEAYKQGKINSIAEYCIRDLDATYALFKLIDSYQPN